MIALLQEEGREGVLKAVRCSDAALQTSFARGGNQLEQMRTVCMWLCVTGIR